MSEQLPLIDTSTLTATVVAASAQPGVADVSRGPSGLVPVSVRDLNFRFRLSEQQRKFGLAGIAKARAALADWHHDVAA
jgi:hypothetical protein